MSNFISLAYLISALCFIWALKGLSSPREARTGNLVGALGMGFALLVTFYKPGFENKIIICVIIIFGGLIGGYLAKKVEMTQMPQLVAGFHSLVGLAAVLTSYAAILNPAAFSIGFRGNVNTASLIEASLGAVIGAVTFSGSAVAFGKLHGLIASAPLLFRLQRYFCIGLSLFLLFCVISFVKTESLLAFNLAVLASLILGPALILPIGGADMPVVVSMLNSYSGFAASGIGFTLNDNLLIITGALVGSSGAILSYIMCRAMNRSLYDVIFGAFSEKQITTENSSSAEERTAKISSPEEAAYLLENSDSVIIVPGYGMAVARSQHAVKELVDLLESKGLKVRFAIHPVAGRMPGHMNVLLAEADIDYDKVLELDEINEDFKDTDVVLIIGANDVTNPAAKNDPKSPIYGMPILDVEKARNVFFIKRSMSSGYSGIENELFYSDNTQMLFGDAKKVVEDLVGFLKRK